MRSINKVRHNHATAGGVDIHFRSAGSPDAPALVLLHGTPSSSHMYRNILSPLADTAYVIAPDMPAFGFSAVPKIEDYDYTFENISLTLGALLDDLGLRSYYLYMHDWGTAVGYYLATRAPERVRGLIVQNGSVHDEGMGPAWDTTKAFWADPSEENRARLPEWLNFEGTRDTYLSGMPEALASLMAPESWVLDWECRGLAASRSSSRFSTTTGGTSRAFLKSKPIIVDISRNACCCGADTTPISTSTR